tara:strand:- start:1171 stop:2787 length:1617 start_codon:yes stop_codon:yes gene_type:complete
VKEKNINKIKFQNLYMNLQNLSVNKKFSKHIKKNFSGIKKNTNKKGIILVEFNGWSSHHICYGYLINSLNKKYSCTVNAYEGYTLISSNISQSFSQKLKWYLGQKLLINNFGIYNEMGAKNFLRPSKSKLINNQVSQLMTKKKFRNRNEVLNFTINRIWVGDLIYDTYLKVKNKPTINTDEDEFKTFVNETIYVFFYWYNYFKNNPVKALIISHSTYLYGMIMRIATEFSVTVYKPTFNTIYKIKNKNYTIGNEFVTYKDKFRKLPSKVKKSGLMNAKKEINLMISGKRKFGIGYNLKRKKTVISKSNKISVMIAMHNFYDSPHVFGKMLFPDFVVWLENVVALSLKTNYLWYFKLHPENTKKDFIYIKSILNKNKNIKIISHKKNQNEIIEMNIRYVLTCFGSIGYEYAYRGITVLNACTRNPHSGYNFTHNPKTINEFNNMVLNLTKYQLKPKKKEILEFFFMRRFHLRINWLKLNRSSLSKGFGWKKNIYRPEIYNFWMKNFSKKNHEMISKTCDNFINSKDYKMADYHLERNNN